MVPAVNDGTTEPPLGCARAPGRMGRVLIDLHAHSTASDGTDGPAELMQAAAAAGLDVVAITDHDNTMGWAPALAARPPGLTVIRGAEFSTSVPLGERRVSVHLLGYLFDPEHRSIVEEQARLRAERLQRGLAIVRKMVAAGVPITADRVLEIADGAPVGRPHIGRALVEAGVVESVDQAFAMHLSDYKKVDGVMLPHKIEISIEGQPNEEWTIEKFKVNPSVKVEEFTKPKQ